MLRRSITLLLLAVLAASLTAASSSADELPTLSIGDVIVTEGDIALFTVTLSASSTDTVTVDYATANGSATSPADYVAASGGLSFVPGDTSETLTVDVAGDELDEADESFLVNLTNASGADLPAGPGVGTITDDDPLPALSVDDVTVAEGDSGTVDAVFTVGLSASSGRDVTVDYATADGSATAPADYTATSGTLNFAAGDTTKQVTVAVNGDLLDELDESFTLTSRAPSTRRSPTRSASARSPTTMRRPRSRSTTSP